MNLPITIQWIALWTTLSYCELLLEQLKINMLKQKVSGRNIIDVEKQMSPQTEIVSNIAIL